MTPEEVARYRAETRGCGEVIHFNNAGSSLPPDCVHDAVVAHLQRERMTGGYEAKAEAEARLGAFYTEVAALIGAKPSEIAYVENATRAWDMAFYSLPLKEGDEILTAEAEYSSNYLAYLQMAKRRGVVVRRVPDDGAGQLDVAALEKMISQRTKLIAVTHVPTHGGLINPAEEIGRIARAHGILYLLDACQSVGQLDVDVGRIGCDMLSATGRKFLRGPRGTGFLYVKEELANRLEPVFIDLHSAEWTSAGSYEFASGARRFENWECYCAGKVGLMEAARYARTVGLRKIESRVLALGRDLRAALADIKGVVVNDPGARRGGIVTFAKEGVSPARIKSDLRAKAINVSVSDLGPDLQGRGVPALVRASVHYYNTEDEITRLCAALAAIQ